MAVALKLETLDEFLAVVHCSIDRVSLSLDLFLVLTFVLIILPSLSLSFKNGTNSIEVKFVGVSTSFVTSILLLYFPLSAIEFVK